MSAAILKYFNIDPSQCPDIVANTISGIKDLNKRLERAQQLAKTFKEENSNFDELKFFKDCDVIINN